MPAFRPLAVALVATALTLPVFAADAPKAATGDDALRSVLMESKDKGRGVAIYAGGVTVNAVVVSVDDRYVVGKNQQSSRIVIRLDRIDGVATSF